MKPNHVPGFLITHSAMAFALGLVCASVIDLGSGAPMVVRGTRLGAGLVISTGAAATLLIQRIALWGWKRHVHAQASEALSGRRALVASDERFSVSSGPVAPAGGYHPHCRDTVVSPTFFARSRESIQHR